MALGSCPGTAAAQVLYCLTEKTGLHHCSLKVTSVGEGRVRCSVHWETAQNRLEKRPQRTKANVVLVKQGNGWKICSKIYIFKGPSQGKYRMNTICFLSDSAPSSLNKGRGRNWVEEEEETQTEGVWQSSDERVLNLLEEEIWRKGLGGNEREQNWEYL